ncbi:hypothetical protein JMJ77_0007497 [Colletotrichum scovillei]|uniref:Uncharacterized protein n=1 Tax=Colletotrichum scovillei TaxID=1209932 RepID=A0A9P7UFN1_9PEZI|nr:hypothetical protein JMJ77_0007497 [Colletotrichum scovillei]KAG7074446.1 hypothetical protein JMJ76_0010925 [Colletotrichum scovillei]KAG7081554.1 hypothetical protein JMJ78_0003672 [Colletotrichum scovillei]
MTVASQSEVIQAIVEGTG